MIEIGFDLVLWLLVLGIAGWVIRVRDTFAAVLGYIVYGLLLALLWVRLAAPDAALTEAVIGALGGVLLLRAAIRLRPTAVRDEYVWPRLSIRLGTAVFCSVVVAGLAWGVMALPDPAPTLAPAVLSHQGATGLGNSVTAVLLAFRATDTLLEAVVLIFALVAVWSLAPDNAWGGVPGQARGTMVVPGRPYLARLLPPVGAVVAVYMFWVGADLPGGKFQAGALLAAMWLLATLAGLSSPPPVSCRVLRLWVIVGTLVFVAIGALGVLTAGAFLAYPERVAKSLILIIEAASMVSIGVTLGLLVVGYPEQRGNV